MMKLTLLTACLVPLAIACSGVGRVPVEPEDAALETDVSPDSYSPTIETLGQPEICTPDCAGKECGPDGCGDICGFCLPGVECQPDGACGGCVPDCAGKECGDDGCGTICGICLPGVACLADGICEDCAPHCQGMECGPDGCGGDCGSCPPGQVCEQTQTCVPKTDPCDGKQCGTWDGTWCGGCPCGACSPSQVYCSPETGLCQEEDQPPGGGCAGIFACMNDCSEGDQGCLQNCINSAYIDEQMAFNSLYQCWADVDLWGCWDLCPEGVEDLNECGDEAMDCYDEKSALCEEEYYACYIPGDLTCEEIFDCFDTCPDDDSPCKQNCYQDGTIEAQKTATAMWDCYEDEGVYDCWDLCPADAQSISQCPPEGQECFDETLGLCQDATNACFPPGFLSCADIGLCIESCPAGAPDCPQECVAAGTAPAQDAFWKLQECILSECGEGSTAECQAYAIEGPCKDAFDACVGG